MQQISILDSAILNINPFNRNKQKEFFTSGIEIWVRKQQDFVKTQFEGFKDKISCFKFIKGKNIILLGFFNGDFKILVFNQTQYYF